MADPIKTEVQAPIEEVIVNLRESVRVSNEMLASLKN